VEELSKINDSDWNCLYLKKPEDGQWISSKKKGKTGHVGKCQFIDGHFTTIEDKSNRMQIIRWKHDLWLPIKEQRER
jgi:hypothetical protein